MPTEPPFTWEQMWLVTKGTEPEGGSEASLSRFGDPSGRRGYLDPKPGWWLLLMGRPSYVLSPWEVPDMARRGTLKIPFFAYSSAISSEVLFSLFSFLVFCLFYHALLHSLVQDHQDQNILIVCYNKHKPLPILMPMGTHIT